LTQFRQVPTFDLPLARKAEKDADALTTSQWYRYWQSHDAGLPPSAETVLAPKASPFTYTAPRQGYVIVNGGTVTAIAVSRSGTFYPTGLTAGSFQVSQNDQLRVTFSVIPSMVFLPT
jgi:hypothetical protein